MIGKSNWDQYLHTIRKREIEVVFSLLSRKKFISGLEIGAGDGFQTTLLAPRIKCLISSDLNFNRIKESLKITGVEYKIIDADAIQGMFEPNQFDFIFSSNVLEHVKNPIGTLIATRPMLKKDGYAIHIVPSRSLKISYLLFHFPNLFFLIFDRIVGKLKGRSFFQGRNINLENNINSQKLKKINRWARILVPTPHGNFLNHRKEFIAFGKKEWERKFKEAGYFVEIYTKGPVFSGYGFGFDRIRKMLESLGISSEHIFILKKAPFDSPG